jgi:hypothetical protein
MAMRFDWHANGFQSCPTLVSAAGTERLFRAWGGDPSRKWGNTNLPGVCFSLDRATSRWHAEMRYAVMEYFNPVRYLTEFSVPHGVPLWVGKVHPGDSRAVLGRISGSQAFIQRQYLHLVAELKTTELPNDLGAGYLYSGKRPRIDS